MRGRAAGAQRERPRIEPGRERAYRVVAPASGTITATLTAGADLDLIALGAGAGASCDPSHARIAASSTVGGDESVSFPVTAGSSYYVVVDAQAGVTAPFTVSVACP